MEVLLLPSYVFKWEFFYRNEPKRDLFTISLRTACCRDCFSNGRKKKWLAGESDLLTCSKREQRLVSFPFFAGNRRAIELLLSDWHIWHNKEGPFLHSTCTPSIRTCSKTWRPPLNVHVGAGRTGGRQSYRVHYLTLMLECVSLGAERTAGCARSSVLVCLGFVWLSFTAVYQFKESTFCPTEQQYQQVPIHISFYFCFLLNTDSGNPTRRRIFGLSTSTVLLILLQSTERLDAFEA